MLTLGKTFADSSQTLVMDDGILIDILTRADTVGCSENLPHFLNRSSNLVRAVFKQWTA
jgi:hypothetical protein